MPGPPAVGRDSLENELIDLEIKGKRFSFAGWLLLTAAIWFLIYLFFDSLKNIGGRDKTFQLVIVLVVFPILFIDLLYRFIRSFKNRYGYVINSEGVYDYNSGIQVFVKWDKITDIQYVNDRNDEKIRVQYSQKTIIAPKSILFQKFIGIIEKEKDHIDIKLDYREMINTEKISLEIIQAWNNRE
jgi:hypothetical protein